MSPSRPYLLNALYEWILDNNCTPYVAVNANYEGTIVPQEFVRGGQIILDINPAAVHKFAIGKEDMQFSARFGGISRQLYVPIPAITAIYAKETGAGMVFPINEYDDVTLESGASEGLRDVSSDKESLKEVTSDKEGSSGSDDQGGEGAGTAPGSGKSSGKKPNLRIVK